MQCGCNNSKSMQYILGLGGGMIYSINIIIQVDFTACSGMLQIMIVTLMYILGLGLSAGAYIAV